MKKETKQLIGIATGLSVKIATFVIVRKAIEQNIKNNAK